MNSDIRCMIWIISEGSPGHLSQSQGFAEALARRNQIDVKVVETRPAFGGFAKSIVRGYMGKKGRGLGLWFVKKYLGCDLPAGRPELLIASGGSSVYAARSLATAFSIPLIFLGERKPFPSDWFHTVLTPSPHEREKNDLPLEMIPTSVTRENVETAALQWEERPDGRLWTMVIGGKSASHPFEDSDWLELAKAMGTLAERHGIRWLVTTSRRTGTEAEAILQREIPTEAIARAIWWAKKPEKKLRAFLGAAERVFVTQDSVTMVTEAMMAGGRPVVLAPEVVDKKGTSFLPGYFSNLEAMGGIERIKISDLKNYVPGSVETAFRADKVMDGLVDAVLTRLDGKLP